MHMLTVDAERRGFSGEGFGVPSIWHQLYSSCGSCRYLFHLAKGFSFSQFWPSGKLNFLKRGRCRIGFNSQKGVQNDIKATRSHQRRNDEELICGFCRSSNCVIGFMGAGSERQSDVKMVEAMRGEESRAINLSLTILNEVRSFLHLQ